MPFYEGFGKEIIPGTGTYEGYFYDNKHHGFGKLVYESGDIFEGSCCINYLLYCLYFLYCLTTR